MYRYFSVCVFAYYKVNIRELTQRIYRPYQSLFTRFPILPMFKRCHFVSSSEERMKHDLVYDTKYFVCLTILRDTIVCFVVKN